MKNKIQRLVMWWREHGWMVKFFAALMLLNTGIFLLFIGLFIIPVRLIDFFTSLTFS